MGKIIARRGEKQGNSIMVSIHRKGLKMGWLVCAAVIKNLFTSASGNRGTFSTHRSSLIGFV